MFKKRELSPPAILQLLSVMVTSEKFFSEVKSGSQLCKSQTCDLIIYIKRARNEIQRKIVKVRESGERKLRQIISSSYRKISSYSKC